MGTSYSTAMSRVASFFRDIRFLLFASIFLCYFLSTNGLVSVTDSAQYILTKAIAERGSFEISDYAYMAAYFDMGFLNNRYLTTKPPLSSMLAVPWYVMGKVVGEYILGLGGYSLEDYVRFYPIGMNAFFGALSPVILYELCRSLGSNRKAAAFSSFFFAFGTINWEYSQTFYRHPVSAFFTLLTFYLAIRSANSKHDARILNYVSGLACGFVILTEYLSALFVPFLLFYLRRKRAFAFVTPLTLCLGLLGAYNYVSFGTPFTWSYRYSVVQSLELSDLSFSRLLESIPSMLVGETRGVFVFSPILVLSIPGFFLMYRAHQKREALTFLGSFIAFLCFLGITPGWVGGGLMGTDRELLVIMPLLCVPAASAFEMWGNRRFFRLLIVVLGALSVYNSVLGVLLPYATAWVGISTVNATLYLIEEMNFYGISAILPPRALAGFFVSLIAFIALANHRFRSLLDNESKRGIRKCSFVHVLGIGLIIGLFLLPNWKVYLIGWSDDSFTTGWSRSYLSNGDVANVTTADVVWSSAYVFATPIKVKSYPYFVVRYSKASHSSGLFWVQILYDDVEGKSYLGIFADGLQSTSWYVAIWDVRKMIHSYHGRYPDVVRGIVTYAEAHTSVQIDYCMFVRADRTNDWLYSFLTVVIILAGTLRQLRPPFELPSFS